MDEEDGYKPPPWLLTYDDMVTLLVTFFVMLISLSTINMDKFKKNMLKVQETLEPDKISLLDDNRLLAENSIENEMEAAESIESFETEEQIENLTDTEDLYNYVLNFVNEGELS